MLFSVVVAVVMVRIALRIAAELAGPAATLAWLRAHHTISGLFHLRHGDATRVAAPTR